jgi:hypothetical protein
MQEVKSGGLWPGLRRHTNDGLYDKNQQFIEVASHSHIEMNGLTKAGAAAK